MPSLDKLKEFTEDLSRIGDEAVVRQTEGTIVPVIPYPDNVPIEDDSLDFEFELPVANKADSESTTTPNDDNGNEFQDEINIDDLFANNEELASTVPEHTPSYDESLDALLGSSQPQMIDDLVERSVESYEPGDESSDDFDFSSVGDFSPSDDLFDSINDFPSFEEDNSLDAVTNNSPIDNDISSLIDGLDTLSDESVPQSSATDDFDFSQLADMPDFDTSLNFDSDSFDPLADFGSTSTESQESSSFDDFMSMDTPSTDEFDFEIDDSLDIPSETLSVPTENEFNDNDFEIPGFSDENTEITADKNYTQPKKKEPENNDRTHLTDKEYELFQKNLLSYPLNLRLAIDEAIVNDEFTDDAIMEVLFKVVKKVSARKLATHLEKMLDTSINVPLNYERRTVEQYEEYKLSIEYQLKNRIIPGLIGTLILGAVLYVLVWLGHTFIYKPVKAEMLYKEGYALIENNLYVQSELKFNEALTYKEKKKWFFEYARAYDYKKQYERARNMYEHLILRFDYDKNAGIEYARMEFDDLANYSKAEEILKRYVLENHINDKDAMLLLGDVYLEWATSLEDGAEKEAKFEQARREYANLLSLYGQTDEYLSRMLRYFMRIDNLHEVLVLKSHFTSQKKMKLENSDLIELGEYLLEKRYGYLSPTDEYLRAHITDLKNILQLAVERDPSIPEAHYNYGQYFIHTNNLSEAIIAFNFAVTNFELAEKQTHERTVKHIDSYRMLGEIYTEQEEYLLAEEEFGLGIRLFEYSERTIGLESTKDIGKLYCNMGDLNYFIAGDLDVALENYIQAIDNKYDNSSVRYKVGYIQYNNGNYTEALNSFVKTAEADSSNRNLLLSLGNVLSMRGNNSAATAQYKRLMTILDADRERYDILFPQVRVDHADFVDLYLKSSNNLGVSLVKLSDSTGETSLQTEAFVHFSESLRAWDALTRNQETMIRLEGTNLAEQNIKYLAAPLSEYEPVIYATIPRTLFGEEGLKQSSLR